MVSLEFKTSDPTHSAKKMGNTANKVITCVHKPRPKDKSSKQGHYDPALEVQAKVTRWLHQNSTYFSNPSRGHHREASSEASQPLHCCRKMMDLTEQAAPTPPLRRCPGDVELNYPAFWSQETPAETPPASDVDQDTSLDWCFYDWSYWSLYQ